MAQTPWIEKAFTQAQDSFEVAIGFPQGLRKVKAQGDNAGKSYVHSVSFLIQISYSDAPGTWVNLKYPSSITEAPRIIVTGPIKNGFTHVAKYYANVGQYNGTKPFTVRIIRETASLDLSLAADEEWAEANKDYNYYDDSVLQGVTGYRNVNPATDPLNTQLAKTALSIQATQQLNGQIEGINGLVQTYCLDWNGTAWVMAATNNPASLFRYVLTHPANPQRILETEIASRVNLAKLQYWHTYCNTTRSIVDSNNLTYNFKFQFNSVLGTQRSVLEVLRDICAAGRASPALLDGKWTINIDEPKSIVQHFSPHNSWGFESTKILPKIPNGLRITFYNEDKNFQQDEITVYNYGYDETNSELFESISLPGITNVGAVLDHGKWHFAQIKLRPEIYTLNTDIEYLVCNRGDRVKVTHDVPMWGLGSGRVKTRVSSTVFELDEEVPVKTGATDYTLRVRSNSSGSSTVRQLKKTFTIASYSVSSNIVTLNLTTATGKHPISVGDTVVVSTTVSGINTSAAIVTQVTDTSIKYSKVTSFVATTALTGSTVSLGDGYYNKIELTQTSTAAEIDTLDLFLFGELNQESQDLVVLSIEPTGGVKNARITLVDYGVTDTYNIFNDYKDLTTAVFETQISSTPLLLLNSIGDLVPTITKAASGDAVMDVISTGIYQYAIRVSYTNSQNLPSTIVGVEGQINRISNNGEIDATIQFAELGLGNILFKNVDPGSSYKIRLRYVTEDGKTGIWSSYVNHTVQGKKAAPDDVDYITVNFIDGGITFKWSPSTTDDYSYTVLKAYTLENNWDVFEPSNPLKLIPPVINWLDGNNEVIFKGRGTTWTWFGQDTKTTKYMIMAKHVDTSGNESINKAQLIFSTEDFVAPPDPTGLTAVPSYDTVALSWNVAVYTEGRGHKSTLLYMREWDIPDPVPEQEVTPSFEIEPGVMDPLIKLIATIDTINTFSFAGRPGTRYIFWIKEKAFGGGVSVGTAGPAVVTTGQDMTRVLKTLEGQIRNEQLYPALATRINLIDNPATGLVTKVGNLEVAIEAVGGSAAAVQDALNAAAAASGSAVSASNSVVASSGSAAQAAISASNSNVAAGNAIIASGVVSGYAVSASGSAVVAATGASNASGYAVGAAFNASGATISATTASNAAVSSSGFAAVAATSASNSTVSANGAAFSASGAALSVIAASNSSVSASGFATVATTSASNASGSASGAAFSASGASVSAVSASNSSVSSSGSAALASSSATSASGSASAAAFSASGATVSVSNASGFTATSSGFVALASSSATSASGSASSAALSASGATVSVSNASGFSSSASGSVALANIVVSNASGFASAAALSASGATVSATSASNAVVSASGSAALATTSVSNASGSASSAALSASGATVSVSNASGFTATASGAAVLASSSASTASGSASAAALSASGATVSVSNASGFTATASGSAALATTSASTASGSASAAALSASGATVSVSNASGFSASAAGSASLASTSVSNASGFASAAGVSAAGASTSVSNASGFAANAAGSVSLASTSVSNASGFASSAGLSASAASTSVSNASGFASSASGSVVLAATSVSNASGAAANALTYSSGASASSVSASGYAASAATSYSGVQATASGYNTTINTAISQKMAVRAESDGTALANYTVTLDANGNVAGFGLTSESTGDSTFAVRANKFYIAATNYSDIIPFKVITTGTPGVYIDTAVIQDASINSAKIGSISVGPINSAINGGKTSGSASPGRVDIDANNGGRIRIYDNSNALRVKIGYLL